MDKNYLIFVLGYDLLQDELNKQDTACDDAYALCSKMIDDFADSGEDEKHQNESIYETLQRWVAENKQKYL